MTKAERAKVQKRGFLHGVAWAIATLNEGYDEPSLCAEVLRAAGTYKDFVDAGTDKMDLKALRKIRQSEKGTGNEWC